MAETDVILPKVQALTVPEAHAHADRLLSRGLSALLVASPEVRRDLCMASRAIRSMLHVMTGWPLGVKTRRICCARSQSTWGAANGRPDPSRKRIGDHLQSRGRKPRK